MDDVADSEIDMNAAQEEISADLFGAEETTEVVEDTVEEVIDETVETTEETTETTAEETEEAKAPPQSWKKEMHETWGSLTKEAQDYIELREQQMREGIDVSKEDASVGRELRDVLTPFNELLKTQGVDQKTAVQYLMNAHYKLSTAQTDQEKVDMLNQMAQSYGVNLDGTKPNPEVQQLNQKIQQLEQIVNQGQQESQQEKQAKAMKEVEAFASEHEFFDDVADDIVPFINTGLTLQESYEKAIWSNPVTREKEIARLDKEKADKIEKEKQDKIEKAKKAKSTNVKAKDTNKAPTGPKGTMFDDLNDLYEEIQSR